MGCFGCSSIEVKIHEVNPVNPLEEPDQKHAPRQPDGNERKAQLYAIVSICKIMYLNR
jgi:hypothetical protein